MSAILLGLIMLVLGVGAGWMLHKAQHHRFLASGFRYLDRVASGDSERTVTEVQVIRAFGSLRSERETR